jgi:hypothetical protein
MRKHVLGLVILAAMVSVAATMDVQAAPPRTVYFWSSAVGQQGLKAGVDSARPGTWGNGAFKDSRTMLYENAQTLQITTRNFREGVRFDLKTPLEIEPYRKTGYVRLRLHFQDAEAIAPTGGPPTRGPGQPGQPGGRGGFGGGGNFGGDVGNDVGNAAVRGNYQLGPLPPLGGMGGLPGEGEAPVILGPTPQTTRITQLLCTLVLDNGIIEGSIDVPKQWENSNLIDFEKIHPDANGWLLFALPIKQMNATPGASGLLRRMILSADQEDTFFLTQAALVVESDKMTVSIRKLSDAPGTQTAEITAKPGALTLVAEVEAGAADPAIEWNFDADNVGNLPVTNPDAPLDGTQPGTQPGGLPVQPIPGLPPAPGAPAGEGQAPAIGPRIDARGLIAKFDYPDEEQNYRVEVTVRDRSGKKEPVKTSVIVHVRG